MLTASQRVQCRQKFVQRMSMVLEVEVYLVPERPRLVFRSTGANRRFRVPAGAIEIGCYRYPVDPSDFLGDLDDALAKLDAIAA